MQVDDESAAAGPAGHSSPYPSFDPVRLLRDCGLSVSAAAAKAGEATEQALTLQTDEGIPYVAIRFVEAALENGGTWDDCVAVLAGVLDPAWLARLQEMRAVNPELFDHETVQYWYEHLVRCGLFGQSGRAPAKSILCTIQPDVWTTPQSSRVSYYRSGMPLDQGSVVLRVREQFGRLLEDSELWYHGTSARAADGILRRGVVPHPRDDTGHDFGQSESFYLGINLIHAVQWAKLRCREHPAVVVFALPSDWRDRRDGLQGRTLVFGGEWIGYVRWSRLMSDTDEYTFLSDMDWIEGPVCYNPNSAAIGEQLVNMPNNTQLAVRDGGAAWITRQMVGVVLF
jgi:hypothetical protein